MGRDEQHATPASFLRNGQFCFALFGCVKRLRRSRASGVTCWMSRLCHTDVRLTRHLFRILDTLDLLSHHSGTNIRRPRETRTFHSCLNSFRISNADSHSSSFSSTQYVIHGMSFVIRCRKLVIQRTGFATVYRMESRRGSLVIIRPHVHSWIKSTNPALSCFWTHDCCDSIMYLTWVSLFVDREQKAKY